MTNAELEAMCEQAILPIEDVGRIMHESWSQTKRAQGFHGYPTTSCTSCRQVKDARESKGLCSDEHYCHFFHPDLIPWEELPEAQKDINRHAFDALLPVIRSKALALAMEVRDKTERETLRMVAKQLRSEQLTWPNKQRAENVNYDIAIEWVAKKLDEMARSLLSEAQK